MSKSRSLTLDDSSLEDFVQWVLQLSSRKRMLGDFYRSGHGLLAEFFRGDQSWRYEAKPYYAVHGVGKVESEGVEGLQRDRRIDEFLSAEANQISIEAFLTQASQRVSLAEPEAAN